MTRDCWKDFAASGRVSDYLKYRKQECQKKQQMAFTGAAPKGAAGGIGRWSETWDRRLS